MVYRFGQLKPVKVIRLLTKDTKDIEIYENRTGRDVAQIVNQQVIDGTNSDRQPSSVHEARRKKIRSKAAKSTKAVKPTKATISATKKGKAKAVSDAMSEDDAVETEEEEEVKSAKRVDKGKGKEVVKKKAVPKPVKEKVVKEKVVKEKVVKEKVVKEKVVKPRKPRASNRTPVEEAEFQAAQLAKAQKVAKASQKQSTLGAFQGFDKTFISQSPKKSPAKKSAAKENDGDLEMDAAEAEDKLIVTTGDVTEEDATTVDEEMLAGEIDLSDIPDDEAELWA